MTYLKPNVLILTSMRLHVLVVFGKECFHDYWVEYEYQIFSACWAAVGFVGFSCMLHYYICLISVLLHHRTFSSKAFIVFEKRIPRIAAVGTSSCLFVKCKAVHILLFLIQLYLLPCYCYFAREQFLCCTLNSFKDVAMISVSGFKEAGLFGF